MITYKVEFDEIVDGYRIVGIMTEMGHRCGYISVPGGHPAFGKDYGALDIDVHWGLTFGQESGEYPVISENVWWFGFDCAHFGDARDMDFLLKNDPSMYSAYERFNDSDSVIRSQKYVHAECLRMLEQFKELAEMRP